MDVEGALYPIDYALEDGSGYRQGAAPRAETVFGDDAVADNPADERYKDLIDKTGILPILNKPIPIVAEEQAVPEFGTGVVKI